MKRNMITVIALLISLFAAGQHKQGVRLRVQLEAAVATDTLELSLWETVYGTLRQERQEPDRFVQAVMRNGVFELSIPEVKSMGYLQLSFMNKGIRLVLGRPVQLLVNYTYEPGDDIAVYFDSLGVRGAHHITGEIRKDVVRGFHFSGKGVSKYILQQQLDSAPRKYQHELFVKRDSKKNPNRSDLVSRMEKQNKMPDEIADVQVNMIREAPISENVRKRLISDVKTKAAYDQTRMIWTKYSLSKGRERDTIAGYYDTSHFYSWRIQPDDPMLAQSVYASDYVCWKVQVDHRLRKNQTPGYETIKEKFQGSNREYFITSYLVNFYETLDSAESILKDASKIVRGSHHRKILDEYSSRFVKGSPAFAFRLVDQKGAVRKLEEFKGKVVFMDFWYTGCGGCLKYYTSVLSKIEHDLRTDPDVVFLTVSIDADPVEWKHSIRGGLYSGADATNVINLYTGGRGSADEVISNYRVTTYPRPILIDKQGNIAESNRLNLQTYDALMRSIQSAKK